MYICTEVGLGPTLTTDAMKNEKAFGSKPVAAFNPIFIISNGPAADPRRMGPPSGPPPPVIWALGSGPRNPPYANTCSVRVWAMDSKSLARVTYNAVSSELHRRKLNYCALAQRITHWHTRAEVSVAGDGMDDRNKIVETGMEPRGANCRHNNISGWFRPGRR